VRALGVDGAGRRGWVGVVVDEHGFVEADVALTVVELIDRAEQRAGESLVAIGIDIPIGLPKTPARALDGLAREFVGPHRRSSVFAAPHPSIIDFDDHAAACTHLRQHGLPGMSIQGFRLIPKIREVATMAHDLRVVEAFPEASFRELAARDLTTSKKTWDGMVERRRLLAEADPPMLVPDTLGPAGQVPVDDVLDAAAVAWSAWRVATGVAECIGDRTRSTPSPADQSPCGSDRAATAWRVRGRATADAPPPPLTRHRQTRTPPPLTRHRQTRSRTRRCGRAADKVRCWRVVPSPGLIPLGVVHSVSPPGHDPYRMPWAARPGNINRRWAL